MKLRRSFLFLLYCGIVLTAGCSHPARRYADGYCSIGTGELNTAFAHWSHNWEAQGRKHFIHEGRGSTVAVDALYRGICDLAPMGRPMNSAELDRFVKKYGERPAALAVAIEGLAIVTHKTTPLERLSWSEMQRLLGETPATWGEVFSDLPPKYSGRPLRVCGISSGSERYEWLRRSILHGRYGDRIREYPDALAVTKALLANECDFAYLRPLEFAGLSGFKALALQPSADPVRDAGGREQEARSKTTSKKTPAVLRNTDFVEPTARAIQRGRNPLSRYFYIYLPPKKRTPPIRKETLDFLNYVLSAEGQRVLIPLGLYPVS